MNSYQADITFETAEAAQRFVARIGLLFVQWAQGTRVSVCVEGAEQTATWLRKQCNAAQHKHKFDEDCYDVE